LIFFDKDDKRKSYLFNGFFMSRGPAPDPDQRRILIWDQTLHHALLHATALENQGFSVLNVSNFLPTAVDLIMQNNVRALLIDVMQGTDLSENALHILSCAIRRRIKVILTTTLTYEQVRDAMGNINAIRKIYPDYGTETEAPTATDLPVNVILYICAKIANIQSAAIPTEEDNPVATEEKLATTPFHDLVTHVQKCSMDFTNNVCEALRNNPE